MFKVKFLDHVAILVDDIDASAKWYSEVLGLEKIHATEWGAFPYMMLGGGSGVALFPKGKAEGLPFGKWKTISHFAFRIAKEDLETAIQHFDNNNIEYEFQNLVHFHSLFIRDPDGYQVELTAQVEDIL